MTALVIAHVKPRQPEKLAAYAEAAARTLEAYGGEVLYRGALRTALLGEAESHGLGILGFPDVQSAKRWFESADYQAITPLREAAAEIRFMLYELSDPVAPPRDPAQASATA